MWYESAFVLSHLLVIIISKQSDIPLKENKTVWSGRHISFIAKKWLKLIVELDPILVILISDINNHSG